MQFGSSKNKFERLTAQMVSFVICCHHGGLIDCIDFNGFNMFEKKVNPEKNIHYDESDAGYIKECYELQIINAEFYKARDEIEAIYLKIKEKISLSTLHFNCLLNIYSAV